MNEPGNAIFFLFKTNHFKPSCFSRTNENIDEIAISHFPNINRDNALQRPILYSNWMDKNYIPVDREELRHYVKARLKVFYEEELDVPLVWNYYFRY